jgi:hypothetical protein
MGFLDDSTPYADMGVSVEIISRALRLRKKIL